MEIEGKRRERRKSDSFGHGAAALLAVAVNFAFHCTQHPHQRIAKKKAVLSFLGAYELGVAMFFISKIVLGDVCVLFIGGLRDATLVREIELVLGSESVKWEGFSST
ncbi:hypothetical protein Salat_1273300 [Sesamum alatum]|uniref:Uncharacterized protein n=1 Tax=Sesamum alatum TaxID=300844 RepID=A0AAE1YGR0_9LAMI|nr:hypothetical protein Salat_1273300 [Sesamum alatum]